MGDQKPTSPSPAGGLRSATRANFEYLVATLSKRTAGKKYENFVVNAIWNALADDTLRPVTQQYVNRSVQHRGMALVDLRQEKATGETSERALIDLYFPALRLGVECDEAQHGAPRSVDDDAARTADIERAIPDYEELRVRVEKDAEGVALSPDAVMDQIDHVVQRIRERKAQVESGAFEWSRTGSVRWRSETPDWKLAREAGELRAGDGFIFAHNGEIRELFGVGDGTGTKFNSFRSNFELADPRYVVWCPTLAKLDRDGLFRTTNTAGYLNWILVEGETVLLGQADATSGPPWSYALPAEERSRRSAFVDRDPSAIETGDASPWDAGTRITFVRTRDATGRTGYQFLGTFTPTIGYREVNGVSFAVCRLISDTFPLP